MTPIWSGHSSAQYLQWLPVAFEIKDKPLTWSAKPHLFQFPRTFRTWSRTTVSPRLPALAALFCLLFLILAMHLPTSQSLHVLFPLPEMLFLPKLCLVSFHSSRITPREPSWTALTLVNVSSFSWDSVSISLWYGWSPLQFYICW